MVASGACGGGAARRGRTVVFASGAELQSMNPLVTIHPLAKQVQRYVLLTTLARYDTALVPRPYLARTWVWSPDLQALRFRLQSGVRWHDGTPTTARDVVWTLNAARDPATGYPRLNDLAGVSWVTDPDDSTVVVRFAAPQRGFPDVLTDLAILPSRLLDTVPASRLREAAWNDHPVGNGPFRFVSHEPRRRWVFAADSTFPAALGGPPRLERFVVVVVDEPSTKLAALTSGEVDFAGIQPAHAALVRRDARLAVLDYPLIFPYGIVLNLRRPPFDDRRVRLALALALDRAEIVAGYLYGLGEVADGPVPPGMPGYTPTRLLPTSPDSARRLLSGRRIGFELLTVGSGEAALEQMIQARLATVGFDVTIRQLELSAFLDRVNARRHEFDAAVLGTPGDPGLGYLAPLAQIAGLTIPPDPAAAQRRFADSLPVVFLYHARGVQGMNRRVRGVRMDRRGGLAHVAGGGVAPRRAAPPPPTSRPAPPRAPPPRGGGAARPPPPPPQRAPAAIDVALVALLTYARGERLPQGEIAEHAWQLEVVEAKCPGGRQDQFAAALGGFHRLSFRDPDVGVEPITLDAAFAAALARQTVLCYTGRSRVSGETIARVMGAYERGDARVTAALRALKDVAAGMVEALRAADLGRVGTLLSENWRHQQALDPGMRTDEMARLEQAVAAAGGLGGKAAGGGARGADFLLGQDGAGAVAAAGPSAGATARPPGWAPEGGAA